MVESLICCFLVWEQEAVKVEEKPRRMMGKGGGGGGP